MITDISQLDLNKSYTYKDYLSWDFPERVELLMGKIFKMSPAPSVVHQRISGNIFHLFSTFLWDSRCDLFSAPFDVILKKGTKSTVVQPDICVVCDISKLDKQGCNGAPEIVIEILSPGNSNREMKEKFELYEKNGVLEYWLVDPEHESVTVYSYNDKKKYIGSKPFVKGEVVKSEFLKGFKVEVELVFRTRKK